MPFAGAAHGVQDAPHVAVEWSSAHAAPQAWKPALQEKPHWVPSQVELPFCGGTGHGVHDVPHVAVESLLAQVPLQSW